MALSSSKPRCYPTTYDGNRCPLCTTPEREHGRKVQLSGLYRFGTFVRIEQINTYKFKKGNMIKLPKSLRKSSFFLAFCYNTYIIKQQHCYPIYSSHIRNNKFYYLLILNRQVHTYFEVVYRSQMLFRSIYVHIHIHSIVRRVADISERHTVKMVCLTTISSGNLTLVESFHENMMLITL